MSVEIIVVGWTGKCGVAVAVAAAMKGRMQRLIAVRLKCISCTIARPQVIFGWELTEQKSKLLGYIRYSGGGLHDLVHFESNVSKQ